MKHLGSEVGYKGTNEGKTKILKQLMAKDKKEEDTNKKEYSVDIFQNQVFGANLSVV